MKNFEKIFIGVFIFITALAFYQLFFNKGKVNIKKKTIVKTIKPAHIKKPIIFYGINMDSMAVIRGKIKKEQRLFDILTPYNVSNKTIYNLSLSAKGIFNLQKLRANKPYDLIIKKDSLSRVKAMVYYHSDIDYIIFHMDDSIFVEKGIKKMEIRTKFITGVINNSLSATIKDMGLSPIITNELADVFAWKVDFFRLYPGDRFKMIYEEQLVEGKFIGINAIKAAVFEHRGHEFFAYSYKQGAKINYFDEKGKSLQKVFLRYPVQFSRISSRFSGRRYHPIQKRYKAHRGTDFAAPRGTPIRTVGDGKVVIAQYGKHNGNYVKITHNFIYATQYLHMSKIAKGIKPGVYVKKGQTIGYVGATGLAAGNHVCYRFWKNGFQVDGLKTKLPSSEAIKKGKKKEFLQEVKKFKKQLNAILYAKQK